MPVTSVFVDTILANREPSLTMVPLQALVPDSRLYTLLFIQPSGTIAVSTTYIKNSDFNSAYAKFKDFLRIAAEERIDLVASPEYSCPWQVIEEAIQNNQLPAEGKIWVLGCESITRIELEQIEGRNSNVVWIYERDLEGRRGNFLDPVCYIFNSKDSNSNNKKVIAIQFKTTPSSPQRSSLERDNLIFGTKRYIFRNDSDSVHLTGLICSDSLQFDFNSLFNPARGPNLRTPYIILHLQMCLKPRNLAFKKYRSDIYLLSTERIFEVLCVNWANGFSVPGEDPSSFGGSAFFTKAEGLDLSDERINSNHDKGIYYTKCADCRAHMFCFNYSEHLFYYENTKASQLYGSAVQNRQTGPVAQTILKWDSSLRRWVNEPKADDELDFFCNEHGCNPVELFDANMTTINKERLLALSNGIVKHKNWYKVDELKYFQSKCDEVIYRMTVAQDPDTDSRNYRSMHLNNFRRLKKQILTNPINFPQNIKDLANDCEIKYPINSAKYNYNLISSAGLNPATVAFVGNEPDNIAQKLFKEMYKSLDENDWRRLVIWYEKDGKILSLVHPETSKIDVDPTETLTAINRTES